MNESKSKRHHLRRAGLVAAGLTVAVVFFVLGGLARLVMGPVSLGPFSGALGDALSNAVPGLSVRYDEAALQWSRDEGRINLVILGARVFDRSQRIIAQAPKAEVDLAAAPLLAGKLVIRQIALVGVQLTLVHTMNGALRLGVERDKGQSDVLEHLRQALSSSGNTSELKSFAVRRARLAFYDERTGLFVVAPLARLQITTDRRGAKAGTITASVDAQIEISGHRAHLLAAFHLPRTAQTVSGDISIKGLDINALGENAKALAFLKPYGLTADLTGSFTLDHGSTRVRDADFGLDAEGTVSGLGHPVHVKSLRLVGRYDGRTGRLLIDDGTLAGNEARARLSGSGNLAFNTSGGLKKADIDLTMDKIAVNMPGMMQQATTLTRVALRANYTPVEHRIAITRLLISGGALSASFKGDVTLSPGQTPAIVASGRVAALDVKDLLHYWPLRLGNGARAWIAENVSAGTIGPVALKANIAAGALDAPALPDDAIHLSFPLDNATVTYLDGLTPLTEMTGTGTLTGNTFTADVSSAKIGPLSVSGGSVTIPKLDVPGSPGDIVAHIDGTLKDVLTLLDMKPLEYPTRFHIGRDSAKGEASIDLKFHVPMVKNLDIDQVGIDIKGQVTGLGLAVGSHKVTDGTANLSIDNAGLRLDGNIVLAGANLKASWDEAFNAKGPDTTHITANGILDDAARKKLNFHSGAYLHGPVDVNATMVGHRGNITNASMTMQLTPATIMIDLIDYKKPPGVPATVQVAAHFKDGAITDGGIVLNGAGLDAHGSATFGPAGTLQTLEFPVLRAGPDNDFTLRMTNMPTTGLMVSITGRSADGAGLGRTDLSGSHPSAGEEPASTRPFQIDANLERLVLRDGVTMAPFTFSTSGEGDKPETLTLSGMMSKTAQLSGDLQKTKSGRQIRVHTNNAGLLMKGLFGFASMRGGNLDLTAALSPTPTKTEIAEKRPPDYRGRLAITDFTVVNQPFLTRLFTAGSLGGLGNLLQGKGIAIDRFDAPFSMHEGVLEIRSARASGPSIGITADGYLDRRNDKIALEGALAPLYGLNSILGSIPLLGDLLVSKKGEGIIGMSYSVSGNADEPKISVNPLSVLTPGIFRRIFEGTPEAPQVIEAEERAKAAAAKAAKDKAAKEKAAKEKAGTAGKTQAAPKPATGTAPAKKTPAPKAPTPPATKMPVPEAKSKAAPNANAPTPPKEEPMPKTDASQPQK